MGGSRDVAELHLAAMAAPDAAGKRYLALADGPTMTFLDVAQVLREQLGTLAQLVPTDEMPGEETPALVIRNDRANRELGFRPRDVQDTIIETAESVRAFGMV